MDVPVQGRMRSQGRSGELSVRRENRGMLPGSYFLIKQPYGSHHCSGRRDKLELSANDRLAKPCAQWDFMRAGTRVQTRAPSSELWRSGSGQVRIA